MKLIKIKKETKSKLLMIAPSLKKKLGIHDDFDTIIAFLIENYLAANQDWEIFDRFWKSDAKGKGKDLYQELIMERAKDEKKYLHD